VLRPLLEPGGVLTGADATLFVRASPGNVEQIRQAVALLDRAPRQLLISVGQGTAEARADSSARGSVEVTRPARDDARATVEARQRERRAEVQQVASVRAVEGYEAYVATGQDVALFAGTGYHGVTSGFYATARVNGDLVTLDIALRQRRARDTRSGPVIDTAGGITMISGRVGEWLPLGAVRESASDESSGWLSRDQRRARSQYDAWVKVDVLP